MKKSGLLAVFLLLVNLSAGAESENERTHSFTFGASFGLQSGAAEEVVYRNGSGDNYVSQLLWQFKPLLLAGVELRYAWKKREDSSSILASIFSGFFVDASFKYGLPSERGLMEDRDWQRPQQPGWLTDYSFHNNTTNTAMLAGLEIGKSFFPYNEFRLSLFLSYRFMQYSFAASGGSFLYPDGHTYEPSPDNIVTYKQTWHILAPGVSFYGAFNRYFDIELFFKASPLILVSSFDEHLDRHFEIINDTMFGGLFIEPGLVFSFKPVSIFILSFSLNYSYINGARGNSTYKYPASTNTYMNVGGAGYSAFDIGLAVKFRAL